MATRRTRKTVRFTKEQAQWLEERSRELGVSQSAFVRAKLVEYFDELTRQAQTRTIDAV